ncbi:MAG: hypothetical protein JWQ40_2204 [Segetibacter sp.]|nr:hypothetical protein [Segetibacter sp.]
MEEDKVDDIRKQGSSGLMVPGEERFHKVYQMIDEADAATIKSYDSISV